MKRGEWKQKLYAVLVTPGASAGVKCRQGSLGVVLLTDMRVPLWGAGVGSVLHVYGVVCIIASPKHTETHSDSIEFITTNLG